MPRKPTPSDRIIYGPSGVIQQKANERRARAKARAAAAKKQSVARSATKQQAQSQAAHTAASQKATARSAAAKKAAATRAANRAAASQATISGAAKQAGGAVKTAGQAIAQSRAGRFAARKFAGAAATKAGGAGLKAGSAALTAAKFGGRTLAKAIPGLGWGLAAYELANMTGLDDLVWESIFGDADVGQEQSERLDVVSGLLDVRLDESQAELGYLDSRADLRSQEAFERRPTLMQQEQLAQFVASRERAIGEAAQRVPVTPQDIAAVLGVNIARR